MKPFLAIAATAVAITGLAITPALSQSHNGYNNGRTGLSVGASNEASSSQSSLGGIKPHKTKKHRRSKTRSGSAGAGHGGATATSSTRSSASSGNAGR